MTLSVIKADERKLIASQVEIANTFWQRTRGLLGRNHLATGSALWIKSCSSIHTLCMRFSIDAIFVDRQLTVRKVVRQIHPFRLVPPVWGAHSVFELAEGGAAEVSEGDQLYVGH